MGRLQYKVAVVTGGAAGIGEGVVRDFVEHGAKVVFADVNAERGNALAAELSAAGAQAHFLQASVDREEEARAVVGAAEARHGRLDVLVNNAAIRAYQDVVQASGESWEQILGVNLKGYIFFAKAAIPVMARGGGGSVINMASVRYVVAGSRTVQYATTKAAILGLTRSMARDHAGDGIRVNAVGPGPIFTDFHKQRARELGKSEEQYVREFGADTLLKRPGTPREVAAVVTFLAGDEASFVTGSCYFVDGGVTAFAEA